MVWAFPVPALASLHTVAECHALLADLMSNVPECQPSRRRLFWKALLTVSRLPACFKLQHSRDHLPSE